MLVVIRIKRQSKKAQYDKKMVSLFENVFRIMETVTCDEIEQKVTIRAYFHCYQENHSQGISILA